MKSSFSLYPRYTAGSPAGVSEALCRRVLAEEQQQLQFVLEGYAGDSKRRLALTKGLAGIALERWEVRGKLFTRDLSTGIVTERGIKQWARYRADVQHCIWRHALAHESLIDWSFVESLNAQGIAAEEAARRVSLQLVRAQSLA